MTKATRVQARTWMLGLMARQAVTMSVDDVKAQIALSLPAMIARFPAEAFCAESLDAVAASERYWNEAGVTKALAVWWKANEPTPAVFALPPEAEEAPLEMDGKRWIAYFVNQPDDDAAARALDLIRSRFDQAPYEYLIATNTRANDIARWRRWDMPASRADRAYEWDDEAAIREMVRKVFALPRGDSTFVGAVWHIAFNALVQAVKINAPQHGEAMFAEMRLLASGQVALAPQPVPVAFHAPEAIPLNTELFGD